jgi:hypothetical protein
MPINSRISVLLEPHSRLLFINQCLYNLARSATRLSFSPLPIPFTPTQSPKHFHKQLQPTNPASTTCHLRIANSFWPSSILVSLVPGNKAQRGVALCPAVYSSSHTYNSKAVFPFALLEVVGAFRPVRPLMPVNWVW